MNRFVVALVMGGVCATSGFGVSPDPKDLIIPPEQASRARELVQQLGSVIYREREEADAELAKMGRLALPVLREAAIADPNPEVRFRSARLLPKAASDDRKAKLETFLADVEGKYEHDLPGWEKFRDVSRQRWTLFGHVVYEDPSLDTKARELFAEIVQSPFNLELLETLEGLETEAGRAIADRRIQMYTTLTQRQIRNGRVEPQQQIPFADIACLLFVETLVETKDIPTNLQFGYITGATFIQQAASMNVLNNTSATHAKVYDRIIARWLDTRDDVFDLNQLVYLAGQQLRRFPESVGVLRRVVTTDGVSPYNRAQAMINLTQWRGKAEYPFLMKQLTDKSQVTMVWFQNARGGIRPGQQQQQRELLMRDVALALLVTHTGQQMADYGFKFPNGFRAGNNNQAANSIGTYAFESDKDRDAAMVKFGFWQLKQSLKEPGTETAPKAPKDEQPNSTISPDLPPNVVLPIKRR